MILSIEEKELKTYLSYQISNCFPDGLLIDYNDITIKNSWDDAIQRIENCFKHILVHGYQQDGHAILNHLHMDQWSQFLYYFSNSIWRRGGDDRICSKIVLLNRVLSSAWFSFKGDLPDVFLLDHPVGTVIGHINVRFSDYLVISQNVTINSVYDGELYLGEGLYLGSGSKIIGKGRIGKRVSVGVETAVRNPDIDDDCVVYRDDMSGAVVVKENKSSVPFVQRFFVDDLRGV